MNRLIITLFERRAFVLFAIFFVTITMGYYAKDVRFETLYDEMLPQNDPFVKTHMAYESQYGGPLAIRAILERTDGTIFSADAIKKINQFTDALDATPGVNHDQIFSLTSRKVRRMKVDEFGAYSVPLVARDKPLPSTTAELKQLSGNVKNTAGVVGTYVSFDNSAAYFQANLIPAEVNYQAVFTYLRSLESKYSDKNTKIYLFGQPVLTGWIYTYNGEVIRILAISFVLMLGMLLYSSKNLGLVLLAGTASLVSAIWGLGFVGMFGWTMDPLILVIPMLIMARTLSHSVQMGMRYVELCRTEINNHDTIVQLFKRQFRPGMLGVVTDAAGIFLIGVADIPMMQKLAIFSGVWALSVIISVLVMMPLMLSYMKPYNSQGSNDRERNTGLITFFLDVVITTTSASAGRNILWFFLLLSLGATLYVAKDISVGELAPGTSLLWPDSSYNNAVNVHANKFIGTDELLVIMEPLGVPSPDVGGIKRDIRNLDIIYQMQKLQISMDNSPFIKGSLSYVDLLPDVARSLSGNHPKFEVLPRTQDEAGHNTHLLQAGSAPGDFDHYFEREYHSASIRFFVADHKAETVNQVVNLAQNRIDQLAQTDIGKHGHLRMAAGSIGLAAATNKEIERAQILNFVLTLIAIIGFIWWGYRSFAAVTILLVPLLFTNIVISAIMVKMGISFNVNTLPIISVGMGVGIDYGIYLLSRTIEESKSGSHGNVTGAVRHAISTSGRAILITAMTMVVAIGAWYFMSNLRFQADMGLLLALVMLINCLGALFIIPLLLISFSPKMLNNTLASMPSPSRGR